MAKPQRIGSTIGTRFPRINMYPFRGARLLSEDCAQACSLRITTPVAFNSSSFLSR